jgi:NTE family protein
VPQPAFLTTVGVAETDDAVVRRTLAPHLNVPLNVPALERDLSTLAGLDRYQAVDWQITEGAEGTGLLVRAREKTYAPPFLMLGLNIENTTSENFRVQFAGRYLTFDALGSGSELRVDAGIGADPHVGASLYKPIGDTAIFARGTAAFTMRTFNFVSDDTVFAEYRERRAWLDGALGVNLSRESEVAGGIRVGHVEDDVRAGDPGLPELAGAEVTESQSDPGRVRHVVVPFAGCA